MPLAPKSGGERGAGTLGHGFVSAHLTPWVGLYSVMSEDSVRKLANTVFPLYENKDSKRSWTVKEEQKSQP